MSDVLAHSSNPDGLSSLTGNGGSAASGNPRTQSAIERLKRRMDSYREMQGARLPQYDQTMNQVNAQQLNETLALRQKFLESKAKKPNKKSSSSSSAATTTVGANSTEKPQPSKQLDMNAAGMVPPANSSINGMMQQPYHGMAQQQQQAGGGMHVGGGHPHPQQLHNTSGSQPVMGGHMNHLHHGPSPSQMGGGSGALKRPLDADEPGPNTQEKNASTTAKRQNLDNGATVKREPSPLESKYTPSSGGVYAPSNSSVQNHHRTNNGGHHGGGGTAVASPDIKPNLSNLKADDASTTAGANDSSQRSGGGNGDDFGGSKDIKSEAGVDAMKQEDSLVDFDLKDFDGFDGMNTDTLQDLMDDLPEFDTFYDTLDFGDNNKNSEDCDDDKLGNEELQDALLSSSQSTCHTTTSTTTSVANNSYGQANCSSSSSSSGPSRMMQQQQQGGGPPVSSSAGGGGGPNAAEALKMMAQQHQQPNLHPQPLNNKPPGPAGSPYPPGQMYINSHSPGLIRPGYPGGQPLPNSSGAGVDQRPGSAGSGPNTTPTSVMSPHMSPNSGGGGGMMTRPMGPQDGDPRLRAAVQQRFRLGNPQSIANSIQGGGGAGPGLDQRMEMMRVNPGLMNSMGGHQGVPMGGMGMMAQQQVPYHTVR
jgi:hypothetical protein